MHQSIDFITYSRSVPILLSTLDIQEKFREQPLIIIKPNLINDSAPPITTPVACCQAIIEFIRMCSNAEIVIAEGCGQPGLDTDTVFDRLGYRDMARRLDIRLVDLNTAELVRLENTTCRIFPEMYLPHMVMEGFLISVPVLKAHSMATITGALKNMLGLAPPRYYGGRHGTWKKSAFHAHLQEGISDLISYRCPDVSLMDASVGMAEFHLGGATCDPPLGKLLGGYNPWEVDREGARLLGLDWTRIGHLHK
ncbi:MAG: DUF362 domain-containing protein [Desulfovermiculus sp.]|nr:DUF362 domain-containing protein [Desulfovermiculus sp.]